MAFIKECIPFNGRDICAKDQDLNESSDEVSFRNDVRKSIHSPMDEELMNYSLFLSTDGDFVYDLDSSFKVRGANLSNVRRFLGIILDEIKAAEKEGLRLSDMLRNTEWGRENIFEHEMKHILKAEQLGVDLDSCMLIGFFTEKEGIIDLGMMFDYPAAIDDDVKAQIASAPENPSNGDLEIINSITRNKNKPA